MFFSWKIVVVSLIGLNLIWVFLFRYRPFVKTSYLSYGVYFVKMKFIACPAAAAYLYFPLHNGKQALLALFWPLVAMLLGSIPPVEIGKLQKLLLAKMGYASIAGEWFRMSMEDAQVKAQSHQRPPPTATPSGEAPKFTAAYHFDTDSYGVKDEKGNFIQTGFANEAVAARAAAAKANN